MVSADRITADTGDFDLRQKVVYPEEPQGDIDTIPNQELAMFRCTWCHDCGFKTAWDLDRAGSKSWKPKFRGEEWKPIVERMKKNDESMLNDELAKRILEYLRDASTLQSAAY